MFRTSNLALYIYTSNNPIIYTDPDGNWDERVHFGSKEYGGTLQWAQDVGMTREHAEIVARANAAVDTNLLTHPIAGDQSYHFNTNNNPNTFPRISSSGTNRDSRMQKANQMLEKAIELWTLANQYEQFNPDGVNINELREAALIYLGVGLHPLQDIYAHSDDYVGREAGRWSHVGIVPGNTVPKNEYDADDPINRRAALSSTRTATYEYIKKFMDAVGYGRQGR